MNHWHNPVEPNVVEVDCAMYGGEDRLRTVLRAGMLHQKASVTNSVIDAAKTRSRNVDSTGGRIVVATRPTNPPLTEFGSFESMVGDEFQEGTKYKRLMKRGLAFEAFQEELPTHWIRIAGKNKHGLSDENATDMKNAVPLIVPRLKAAIEEFRGITTFGVIWEGDNYEFEKGDMSPFSGLIAAFMEDGIHCMAIKERGDGAVSNLFYDGWADKSPSNTWMMLVNGIKKEQVAKSLANLGTFFLGSGHPDHQMRVSPKMATVKEYTTGFKQVLALRAQPEEYEELFFDHLGLPLDAALMFLKYP